MGLPPSSTRRVQDTRIPAIILAAALVGCAGSSGVDYAQREALADDANELVDALDAQGAVAGPGDTLRVQLAFGNGADLDLYVTDPNEETAYFANSQTKLGATLAEDLRCDTAAPRIEVVTLRNPIPGRYRVGVDYPKACGEDRGRVSFVVYLEADGSRESRRGSIEPGEFLMVVLEATVGRTARD